MDRFPEALLSAKTDRIPDEYDWSNNENMIQFLRSKGYTVLNMIEIRKPYKGEKLSTTIHVEKEAFDY